jgi:glutamine synthetase
VAPQLELLGRVTAALNGLQGALDDLGQAHAAEETHSGTEVARARHTRDRILPAMEALRVHADALEQLVDDDLWPLPKYDELLLLD